MPDNLKISNNIMQTANRARKLWDDTVQLFYRGMVLSVGTNRTFDFDGSLLVAFFDPYNQLVALTIQNDLIWEVQVVEPFIFEFVSADTLPEVPIQQIEIEELKGEKLQTPLEDNEKPERRVRIQLIDPILEQFGWTEKLIRREESFRSFFDEALRFRMDYSLYVLDQTKREYIPIALIEAKHDGCSPKKGLEQAKMYAAHWRRNVRFVFSTNGHHYIKHDRLTGTTSNPETLDKFPNPNELRELYLKSTKDVDRTIDKVI